MPSDARPRAALRSGRTVARMLSSRPAPPGVRAAVLATAAAAAGLSGVPAAHADARPWRPPVTGEVVAGFSYSTARPFAAGQRRGIDLAAPPGSVVGAACAGRVSFAGRLPSGARGVSVRCGGLTATHLGLARVAVRRGATVRAGAVLGTAGRGGRVRLGARVTARRFGYVDPLALLGAERPGPPAAPLGRAPARPPAVAPGRRPSAPLGRAPRPGRVPVAGVRHRVPAPATRLDVPRAAADAAAPTSAIPPAAGAGLVLLASGLPVGGLIHAARRRRAAPIPSARWFACSPSSRP